MGVNIVVARILGPSAKGIFAFMMLMGESLVPVMFLGFGVGVVYLVGSEQYKAKDVAISSLIIGLLKGGLITLLLWFLWTNEWLGETAKEIPPEYMIPILISLPLSGSFTIAKQIFKGASDFGVLNIITLVSALANAVFLVIFVWITDWGLQGAVIAIIVQKVLTNLAILYLIIRRYKPSWRIHGRFISESYNYGIKAWFGNMATRANDRFDQIILGFFANSTLLGYYSVAFSLVRFMGYFPQAIAPVLFNIVARSQDMKKSAFLLAQVHRSMLILVGSMVVALALSGKWLIPFLYGEEYNSAFLPMLIMLPGMFVYAASRRIINKFLGANGMPGKMSIVQGVGAVTGLVLYLILIPVYDIVGAAIGSTVAYLTSSAAAFYFFYRIVPFGSVNMFRVTFKDIRWIWERSFRSLGFLQKLRYRLAGRKPPKKETTVQVDKSDSIANN